MRERHARADAPPLRCRIGRQNNWLATVMRLQNQTGGDADVGVSATPQIGPPEGKPDGEEASRRHRK
ncbi:hypothetical protein, partial [Kozakia baliensis]|uniref:hypothetical protein n=1 Tax=Kozakia baliensis TaxID=153496 RepID=UPI00222EF706